MIKEIKIKNEELEIVNDKLTKLKELFPDCFNKSGNFDIENFKNNISKDVDFTKEGYGLNFLGKNYAKLVASLETETILVPDLENNIKSENFNSENIYISGDNIDALKHLTKSYTNKIKCIYIDPPYNTGKDGFVYNDKFDFSIDKLIRDLDINEEEAKRIFDMTNNKSNSHSAWATFMFSRLYLAKQLLKQNGVIFISIDDNEHTNLKMICDNIFGEENFLGNLPTIMNLKGNNDEYAFSGTHEYTLVYSKNKDNCEVYEFEVDSDNDSDWDEDEYGFYKKGANLKATGVNAPREKRPNLFFPLYINRLTKKCSLKRTTDEEIELFPITDGKEMSWRWGKDKFFNQPQDLIVVENNNQYSIYKKQRPTLGDLPTVKPKSILYKPEYSSGNGTARIKELFGYKIFDNPKPVNLIYDLLQIGASEDDIVLDFFGGSSTTAEAILRHNAFSKCNKNLKYILVQLNEKTKVNSEANKNGFNTIDQVGQERIRSAAKKIKEEISTNIDYGFKHYTIKNIDTNTLDKLENFEPNYMISDETILDEFGIESILTTWILSDGYGLTDVYRIVDLDGYEAYSCEDTIYLIKPELSDKSIKCLIEKYEKEKNFKCNRIVLFGYSFALNEIQTLKDNLRQVKNIKNISVDVITRY
ncbi:MAG: site-specific DNA-methyltransferase [Mycoplasmatota bacterium]